jgi:hypothetical protein
MSMALQDICQALGIPADDTATREIIASRIIELTRLGERSPTVLRDRVLREAKQGRRGFEGGQRSAGL